VVKKCSVAQYTGVGGTIYGSGWHDIREWVAQYTGVGGTIYGSGWHDIREWVAQYTGVGGTIYGSGWHNVRESVAQYTGVGYRNDAFNASLTLESNNLLLRTVNSKRYLIGEIATF
jgi:hypothetical protein